MRSTVFQSNNHKYGDTAKYGNTCMSQKRKVETPIQGVTGGTDQTSGECSLGHTIPI